MQLEPFAMYQCSLFALLLLPPAAADCGAAAVNFGGFAADAATGSVSASSAEATAPRVWALKRCTTLLLSAPGGRA